jgi:hypothetical protein
MHLSQARRRMTAIDMARTEICNREVLRSAARQAGNPTIADIVLDRLVHVAKTKVDDVAEHWVNLLPAREPRRYPTGIIGMPDWLRSEAVAVLVGTRTRKKNEMASSIFDTIRPPGSLKVWNNGQRRDADNGRTHALDGSASERPTSVIALSGTDETRRAIGATRRPSQHGR